MMNLDNNQEGLTMNKNVEAVLGILGLMLVMTCVFGLQYSGWSALDIQGTVREYGYFDGRTLFLIAIGLIIWSGGALIIVLAERKIFRKYADGMRGVFVMGVAAGAGAAGVSSSAVDKVLGGILFGWLYFISTAHTKRPTMTLMSSNSQSVRPFR